MQNLSGTRQSINAVVPNYLMAKTTNVMRNTKMYLKSSSSESTLEYSLTGTPWTYLMPVERDPNGSAAWTNASVDAAEVGVEIT
jgi:hypothetical protein